MSLRSENNQRNLSHSTNPDALEEVIESLRQKIRLSGDKPHVSVARQLEILDEFAAFDLGRFLIQNNGINGYWTHYIVTFPKQGKITGLAHNGKPLTKMESLIFNEIPGVLATQERYQHFLVQNQQAVREGTVLACIPCGWMGELLHLNYSAVKNFRLVGIDIDEDSLTGAFALAKSLKLEQDVELFQQDAWALSCDSEFDLISSNGLNIYEPDKDKVSELYRLFYLALKSGGKLVTSFLTDSPFNSEKSEWDLTKINPEAALLQRIIYSDILTPKWASYYTFSEISEQLARVGFKAISVVPDQARMFPTVVAIK